MFKRLTARFTEMDIDLVKRGADPFGELMFTVADCGVLQIRVADLPSRYYIFCLNRSLDRLRPYLVSEYFMFAFRFARAVASLTLQRHDSFAIILWRSHAPFCLSAL